MKFAPRACGIFPDRLADPRNFGEAHEESLDSTGAERWLDACSRIDLQFHDGKALSTSLGRGRADIRWGTRCIKKTDLISGYIGSAGIFDEAICDFAVDYAHHAERDHKGFVRAFTGGGVSTIAEFWTAHAEDLARGEGTKGFRRTWDYASEYANDSIC